MFRFCSDSGLQSFTSLACSSFFTIQAGCVSGNLCHPYSMLQLSWIESIILYFFFLHIVYPVCSFLFFSVVMQVVDLEIFGWCFESFGFFGRTQFVVDFFYIYYILCVLSAFLLQFWQIVLLVIFPWVFLVVKCII